jgi:hypothetical protein
MAFIWRFAITTGPWNHSHAALRQSRECVIAVPAVDQSGKAKELGVPVLSEAQLLDLLQG